MSSCKDIPRHQLHQSSEVHACAATKSTLVQSISITFQIPHTLGDGVKVTSKRRVPF